MFGRVTITLGIGPHSSSIVIIIIAINLCFHCGCGLGNIFAVTLCSIHQACLHIQRALRQCKPSRKHIVAPPGEISRTQDKISDAAHP